MVVFFADPDYKKFLESLENPTVESSPPIERYIEEIEAKEKELKGTTWMNFDIFEKPVKML